MAEYRLEELARLSEVSTRNIRAYRERGLLDAPTRAGRSALYGDAHLAQLKMISELLGRGFTLTHIAEFFARMNEGHDVAQILGLQRPAVGPPGESLTDTTSARGLALDPAGDDAARLVDLGLAEVVDGAVVLIDADLADVVAAAPDQHLYVGTILRIQETAKTAVDDLARRLVNSLREHLLARFGQNVILEPADMTELRGLIQAYQDLAITLTSLHLEQALEQRIPAAVSDFTAGVMGGWRREAGTA